METIRITGVPEHFNYPWQQMVKDQPFLEDQVELVWENEPRGSGAMNSAIRTGATDLAIILTESFLKDKVEGNSGKIIGYHVKSPLVWGIHVPSASEVHRPKDLENAPFLVSRMGSGSHLMTYLLAKKEGWDTKSLNFDIVSNLEGAINSFKDKKTKGFLWEKFTTKPLVDDGHFRRVGEIPTPWPCFVIVASEKMLNENKGLLKKIQKEIYRTNKLLMEDKQSFVLPISVAYKLDQKDIQEWMSQTNWATDGEVPDKDVITTLDALLNLGLIDKRLAPDEIIEKL
ncbi:ABC transporter substrate-binding protein [uncultured Cyclobacterium sp.]|uniref:ABC transporter substrate-binding protein n=1 Tax=uncultured Cyclobacterium sp. TaxID=453820 RepID=UPI0030EB18FC|tara:strand:+ start:128677 stop:129534 length:858 start_codon:yes stop_codon:yes gene_type:complete